jgi:hypothetical protein
MTMKTIRTALCLLALAGGSTAQVVGKESDETAAIVAATKSYVATTSAITKVTVSVEQVADDFARAKVTPEDSTAADPAWVFLKKQDGKWTGLVLGTSFTVEDYQQLGIPNALRVP